MDNLLQLEILHSGTRIAIMYYTNKMIKILHQSKLLFVSPSEIDLIFSRDMLTST